MKAIIATTHQDEKGTFTRKALSKMAEDCKGQIFSVSVGFGLKAPPVGSAEIIGTKELLDGCLGLVAELNVSEVEAPTGIGISFSFNGDKRPTIEAANLTGVALVSHPSDPHCSDPEVD